MDNANVNVGMAQGGDTLFVNHDGAILFESAGIGSSGINVMNASGYLVIERLPTEDPEVAGAVWASGNYLMLSEG